MSQKSHVFFSRYLHILRPEDFCKFQINGIRVLKFHKDKVLLNSMVDFYDNAYHRALNNQTATDKEYAVEYVKEFIANRLGLCDNYVEPSFRDHTTGNYALAGDTTVLDSALGLKMYGELASSEVLFKDQIVYINNDVVHYYDTDNTIKKINRQQLRNLIRKDKDYHTVVLIPQELHIKSMHRQKLYPTDKVDLFNELISNSCGQPAPGKLCRVKNVGPNIDKICELKAGDIVYVNDKGTQRNKVKILTRDGQALQLFERQLESLPSHLQDSNDILQFKFERQRRLYEDQETGYPVLIKPKQLTEFYLMFETISGEIISVPRSLIPKLPVINEDLAQWINIPKWYYEKYIISRL